MPINRFRFLSALGMVCLLAGLILGISQPVRAQTGELLAPPEVPGEAVYVPFPVKITLDGKLDDWKNIPVQVVTKGSAPSKITGEDSPLSFAVAADDAYLYLNLSIVDKNIVTGKHDANYWNEDSLEFFLNTSPDLNAASLGPDIFQVNINPGDIGNTDPSKLIITGKNYNMTDVHGFVFKTANGWGAELSVPLKNKPTHGQVIGFQVQANGASTLDRDSKLIWSKYDTADQSWQFPYLFGQAIFFAVGSKDIPAPAARLSAPPTQAPTPTAAPAEQRISVNQDGYFANAPKQAVIASKAADAIPWTLTDAQGATLLEGKTTPLGTDTASGDSVHLIDFTPFTTPGKGYILKAGNIHSDPFEIGADIYSTLKIDAQRYFYLSRSGMPLDKIYAGQWTRPAGHLTDNKVTCYAGPDASGKQWPACDYTLDASGGWYDAGDYGKYVVNGGIAVWTLLDAYEHNPKAFADGVLHIPESSNKVPDILDEARWEMDFLLSMQVPDGQPFAGMVHHKLHGLQWDAMPAAPPAESTTRYLFPPSTAATLNLAATAAQCARVWKDIDSDFSARCLKAADTAWQAAQKNPNMLAAEFPTLGGGGYGDSHLSDELYWAAVELYITTGKAEYQKAYSTTPLMLNSAMNWGGTAPLGVLSLAVAGKDKAAQAAVVKFADQIVSVMYDNKNGYRSPVPAKDYQWGSNSEVLNRAIMLALAYDYSSDIRYLNAVTECMNYLLGRNTLNFSFISGYGTTSLSHPHHRFWGNQPENGFPPPPPGVIAGGPNSNPADTTAQTAGLQGCPPAKCYDDQMGTYTTNEVAINWNAPLVWVATYLDDTGRPALSKKEVVPSETPLPNPATATPVAVPQQPTSASWLAGLAIAIVLVIALVVALILRRRSENRM